jgi:undecaprenyl-diphosphatase
MPSWILQADDAVLHLLSSHHTAWLDALALVLAAGGRLGLWVVPAVAVAGARRGRWAGVCQMALALLLAWAVTDGVLKPAFGRGRPFTANAAVQVLGARPTDFSFPSGHASSAFAGAFALTRVWPAAGVVAWSVASLVALGRVYQGVHYPLDVIAGALVGLGCAYLAAGSTACYIDHPPERSPTVPR